MKKRFLSATLAAILAASSLSVAAFADDPDPLALGADTAVPNTTEGTQVAGQSVVELTGSAHLPSIQVTLPASIGFVLNPYKLTVITDATTTPKTTDNNLVLSKPITVTNSGESKIAVNVTAVPKAEGTGEEIIISNTGAIDTKTSDIKNKKQVAIWVEPATQKHITSVFNADGTKKDGTGITTYTFANKYNAKTCALATTYTAPTPCANISVSTVYTTLGAAYSKTGKTITSDEWTTATTGSTSAEKWAKIAKLLISKGASVTVGSNNKVLATNAEVDTYVAGETFDADTTAIKTDLQKVKAVGVEPATITLFTLAPGGDFAAKESGIKNAPDNYTYPNLDTNVGQFKICGTLNQDIDGNWTAADTVNVTLTFNIKLLSN